MQTHFFAFLFLGFFTSGFIIKVSITKVNGLIIPIKPFLTFFAFPCCSIPWEFSKHIFFTHYRDKTINGIPITKTVFGDIQLVDGEGNVYPMPEICDDTIYIVSALVARASDRPDFFIVNETVRDEKGRIIGYKSFARV